MNMVDSDQHAQQLLARLRKLRTALRIRLVAYGLCAVATGGTAALLATVALDWLLHMPAALRVVGAVLFVVGFALASLHWIGRPLRASLSPAGLAQLLEQQFPQLNDRLSSTVAFLTGDAIGSTALRAEAITRTHQAMGHLQFKSLFDNRRLFVGLMMLLLGFAVMGAVIGTRPAWLAVGMARFLDPFSGLDWPRKVQIVPLSGDRLVARGEPVTLKMRIVRGRSRHLRGFVKLESADGKRQSRVMSLESSGIYACRIERCTQSQRFWFEAGDESTRDRPYQLRVASRPRVEQITGIVHPPDYAAEQEPVEVNLRNASVELLAQSTLEIVVRSTKPVAGHSSETAAAKLLLDDGTAESLNPTDTDPRLLRGMLPVETGCTFRIELIDTDGLSNSDDRRYHIIARRDAPPTVRIEQPPGDLAITPAGSVIVRARATDDLGVALMQLQTTARQGQLDGYINLTQRMKSLERAHQHDTVAQHEIAMSTMNFAPGDTLRFRAIAFDRCNVNSPSGQRGESSWRTITIQSEQEYRAGIDSELDALRVGLRDTVLDQQAIRGQTPAHDDPINDASRAKSRDRIAIQRAFVRQNSLTERTRHLAKKLETLARKTQSAGLSDRNLTHRLTRAASNLDRAAKGPMTQASSALKRAAASTSQQSRRAATAEARTAQTTALDQLKNVRESLARQDEFARAISAVRDILDRQQRIQSLTHALDRASENAATHADTMRDEQRTLISQRQKRLGDDMQSLVRYMQQAVDTLAEADAPAAAVLDSAVHAATGREIVTHMRRAADAIVQRRTTGTRMAQRASEDGLLEMLALLHNQQKRRLERLIRRLESRQQLVEHLLTSQRLLLTDTRESIEKHAPATAFVQQGKSQRRLADNTRHLVADWPEDSREVAARSLVDQATNPMSVAAEALIRANAPAATEPQTDATAFLEAAAEELKRLALLAEDEAQKLQTAATLAELNRLRGRQQDVHDGVDALKNRLAEHRINRRIARQAARLSREQQEIEESTQTLAERLASTVVFRFVLDGILVHMNKSVESLEHRQINEALAAGQDRILDEMDTLITAMTEMYTLPAPDQFARESSGGGGASQTEASASVPTLAELLVLKSMQRSLQQRIETAARDYDPDTASEQRLRQVRALADDQRRIRKLAAMLIKKARAHE